MTHPTAAHGRPMIPPALLDAALVEAAARAEYSVDMAAEESDDFEPFTWEQALTKVREYYLARARAGLEAALTAFTVVEEQRVVWSRVVRPGHAGQGSTSWYPASSGHARGFMAETDELFPGRYVDKGIERRWVITTAPEEAT